MAAWKSPPFPLLGLLSFLLHPITTTTSSTSGIRVTSLHKSSVEIPVFHEAPEFRNGDSCGSPNTDRIHVSMTLDANYLRGTMAAILAILLHSTCPESIVFHFLSARSELELFSSLNSTFPYLDFKVYRFDSNRVRDKISKSIRQALDQPFNYAQIYLADIIPADVDRTIYLDSDIVMVGDKLVAAPEYCHANFTKYFTDAFWKDKELAKTFQGRNPIPLRLLATFLSCLGW